MAVAIRFMKGELYILFHRKIKIHFILKIAFLLYQIITFVNGIRVVIELFIVVIFLLMQQFRISTVGIEYFGNKLHKQIAEHDRIFFHRKITEIFFSVFFKRKVVKMWRQLFRLAVETHRIQLLKFLRHQAHQRKAILVVGVGINTVSLTEQLEIFGGHPLINIDIVQVRISEIGFNKVIL